MGATGLSVAPHRAPNTLSRLLGLPLRDKGVDAGCEAVVAGSHVEDAPADTPPHPARRAQLAQLAVLLEVAVGSGCFPRDEHVDRLRLDGVEDLAPAITPALAVPRRAHRIANDVDYFPPLAVTDRTALSLLLSERT